MLWTYNDDGYLISVDMPEKARCRSCGAEYIRKIRDARPWQSDGPDECPACGHVHGSVSGVRFENVPVPEPGDQLAARAGALIPGSEYAARAGRLLSHDDYASLIADSASL